MNRRLVLGALAVAFAALLSLVPADQGRAAAMQEFRPGAIQAALASGKAVLIDYAADWCSTCARQKRVIDGLRAENPAYDANIVFIRVDWDAYRRHEVATSRGVPRRSTLILLQGDQELGRLVAGTSRASIKALLDRAVASSS